VRKQASLPIWSQSPETSFICYDTCMYYRRKVLLALIQKAGGRINKYRLQKFMFLMSRDQSEPTYHFVPYHYGSFSFESYADLRALVKHGVVVESPGEWELKAADDFFATLKAEDRQLVERVEGQFRHLSEDDLIRYTYLKFPFFAIHSKVAATLLNKKEMAAVEAEKPTQVQMQLFTLGYEGLSVEEYLLRLIQNNVKVLCDVRRNAMSMKYGFTKSTLAKHCSYMGIEYVHVPNLGIESGLRKELKTRQDYMDLFEDYEAKTLPKTLGEQSSIVQMLAGKKRVALTCFESDHTLCHRSRVADALTQLPGWEPQLAHL
jgi:uncharacterized protein (DUF488 family)